MPLCVTEAARDELMDMLDRMDQPEDRSARFVVRGDRLRLTIDEPRSGDVNVDHAGRTVLVLDEAVATFLNGKQLDKAEPAGGRVKRRGLTLTNQSM